MPLILTEEQTMLKEAADGFLAEHAPITHLRQLRDSRDPDGVSRDLWRAFGEMGFAGVIIPEEHGGSGLGAVEAGVVAEALGRTLTLNGAKGFVLDGHIADALIVAAKTEGGTTLFLVDPKSAGIEIERTVMVDSHNAARITLNDVQVDADAVIGAVDGGEKALNAALDLGRACAAACLTGAGDEAFRVTTEYLRTRKQFGKASGAFQALQHRAAHLFTELEIAKAATLAALQRLDAGADQADLAISIAKAKAGRVAELAVQEAVQMHGGVGMTDEYDVGLFMKRVRVLNELLGDAGFHQERLAQSQGF